MPRSCWQDASMISTQFKHVKKVHSVLDVKLYCQNGFHRDTHQRSRVSYHQHIHQKKSLSRIIKGPAVIRKMAPDILTALSLLPVMSRSIIHQTLSCSGRTNLKLILTCIKTWSFHTHSPRQNSPTFTNLASICPYGVRCLEYGMPTGGRVNYCNPESTHMPLCASLVSSNHRVLLWGMEGVHASFSRPNRWAGTVWRDCIQHSEV